MGLNSYQVTFESCGDHYQIYGRDIQYERRISYIFSCIMEEGEGSRDS